MKKREKGILLGLFASIIIFTLILNLSFVSSTIQSRSGVSEGILGTISDAFRNSFDGDGVLVIGGQTFDISRILLMLLVTLLVYSIAEAIPFLDGEPKKNIRLLFAIVVAILSFISIDGDTIRTILANYEVLGVVLTSVIPLIIIMAFTFKLEEKNSAMAFVVNKVLYVGFIIYLLVKWFSIDYDAALEWVYIVTAVIVLVWMLIKKNVWKTIKKEQVDKAVSNIESKKKLRRKLMEEEEKDAARYMSG